MAFLNQVNDLTISSTSHQVAVQTAAIVYCEGNFAGLDGKTAHGLVRFCEAFKIRAIIDSQSAGIDAGLVLDGISSGIPIVADLGQALALPGSRATTLIYGRAPAGGLYGKDDRRVLMLAMEAGLNLVSGMREFLNDDPEFALAAARYDVSIRDVRRPPALKDLRLFSGSIAKARCIRIAVLGTDGAIGKRTTATLLVQALNASGIHAVLVSTGQPPPLSGKLSARSDPSTRGPNQRPCNRPMTPLCGKPSGSG